MTSVHLRASRGRQQDHGRAARVRGIDMRRASMAALMAAVVSASGVGLGPAQSVEIRRGTERPAVQERAAIPTATPQQASGSPLRPCDVLPAVL